MPVFGWLLIFIIISNVGVGVWKSKKWEDQNKAAQQDKELARKNEVHMFTYFKPF